MKWVNGKQVFEDSDYAKWNAAFEVKDSSGTALGANLDDLDRESYIESLFKRLPSEDPVRLLRAVTEIEDYSDWIFSNVNDNHGIVFDKMVNGHYTFINLESLESAEEYARKLKNVWCVAHELGLG